MLCKLDQQFCQCLKIACKQNKTINRTLIKYKNLQTTIVRRKKELTMSNIMRGSDDYSDDLLDVVINFIEANFNMNEICLLLAINATKKKQIESLRKYEFASVDLGLSLLQDLS